MPDKDWRYTLWPDPEAVLKAVGIKPDMEPDDVRRTVEPAGFTLEKVIDVGRYHYAAVFVPPGVFLNRIINAGFIEAELAGFTDYRTSPDTVGALFRAVKQS